MHTRRFRLLLGLLALCAPLAASPAVAKQLPAFADLKDGWNTLTPGGETSCAVDPNYRFFVRRAAADRLLVFFEGGGACMDGRSCDPSVTFAGEPAFKATVSTSPPPPAGIFDLANPDNPFAAYSIVYVSYCTGDLHLGAQDATYTNEDARGKREFGIKHRGPGQRDDRDAVDLRELPSARRDFRGRNQRRRLRDAVLRKCAGAPISALARGRAE